MGDYFGYRLVIIVNIVLMAVSATCFDLTPRYSQSTRSPTAVLYSEEGWSSAQLAAVEWAICDPGAATTPDNCRQSEVVAEIFTGIGEHLSCPEEGLRLDENFAISSVNVTQHTNGSYCRAETVFFSAR